MYYTLYRTATLELDEQENSGTLNLWKQFAARTFGGVRMRRLGGFLVARARQTSAPDPKTLRHVGPLRAVSAIALSSKGVPCLQGKAKDFARRRYPRPNYRTKRSRGGHFRCQLVSATDALTRRFRGLLAVSGSVFRRCGDKLVASHNASLPISWEIHNPALPIARQPARCFRSLKHDHDGPSSNFYFSRSAGGSRRLRLQIDAEILAPTTVDRSRIMTRASLTSPSEWRSQNPKVGSLDLHDQFYLAIGNAFVVCTGMRNPFNDSQK
ncbi:hypothetical protein BKA82DRAFT_31247 [Pisolithus tinctorius]|nr:hypothetical protein BKA82DRAFT_31247 [Pisolithus tinctorius]